MILNPFKSLLILGLFIYFLIDVTLKKKRPNSTTTANLTPILIPLTHLFLGIILLPIGGQLVIDSASTIAVSLGISQALISLLAIAIGTSLPELSASIIAAIHNDTDIAIGNILGSNIFNIGLILSVSGLVMPLSITTTLFQKLSILIGVSVLFSAGILLKRSDQFTRLESGLLLAGYGVFIVTVMIRA